MADKVITVDIKDNNLLELNMAEKEIISVDFNTISAILNDTLQALRDTNLSNLQNKDMLQYNSTLEKWINKQIISFDENYKCFIIDY